jgi:hypothetical protein
VSAAYDHTSDARDGMVPLLAGRVDASDLRQLNDRREVIW